MHDNAGIVQGLKELCSELCDISKIAEKNKKSLTGNNFYGDKFHGVVVEVSKLEQELTALFQFLVTDESDIAKYKSSLSTIKSPITKSIAKREALRALVLISDSKLLVALANQTANPIPKTEQVLPLAVVSNTRGYLTQLVVQMNGCYEHQWFDACSVMLRKFVEIAIIEVYKAKSRTNDITDAKGNYDSLGVLVSKISGDPAWNLDKATRRLLPELKKLGDHAAHTPHYICTKPDVDRLLSDFRVAADDLLHLASLK